MGELAFMAVLRTGRGVPFFAISFQILLVFGLGCNAALPRPSPRRAAWIGH